MERIDQYVSWLLEHGGDHSGLRYAVDCSNGMAGVLAGRLFPDALLLNAEIDGRFPSHSPKTAVSRW